MVQQAAAIIILYLSLPLGTCFSPKDVNDLKRSLMEGYDKSTNPVTTTTANVDMSFRVNSIGDLDETSEKLTTVLLVTATWKDEFFQWNETENGIEDVHMDPEVVWVPELKILNQHYAKTNTDRDRLKMPVTYRYDGIAWFYELITAETSCELDTWKFPFDHHVCPVQFIVNKMMVNITSYFKDFILSDFQPDGSWDVIEANISADYNFVNINITFFRKPTFILVNLVLPITTLALLSPMVFLLPNQSGERVGFSITTLLAISVYMTIISDHLPKKSSPMPLLSSMLLISYMLTAVVVFIAIINARIYRASNSVAIPRYMMCLVAVTKCLCRCCKRRNTSTDEEEDEEEGQSLKDDVKTQDVKMYGGKVVNWKDVSWAIDMFFFTLLYIVKILLIIIFLVVLQSKDPHGHIKI